MGYEHDMKLKSDIMKLIFRHSRKTGKIMTCFQLRLARKKPHAIEGFTISWKHLPPKIKATGKKTNMKPSFTPKGIGSSSYDHIHKGIEYDEIGPSGKKTGVTVLVKIPETKGATK